MSTGYVRSALWALIFFTVCCMAFVPVLRLIATTGNYLMEYKNDR